MCDVDRLREEVAFWRREAVAHLQISIWRLTGAGGDGPIAEDARSEIQSTLAALHAADSEEWYDRCAVCREFIRTDDRSISIRIEADGVVAVHGRCGGQEGVVGRPLDDQGAIVARARQLIAVDGAAGESGPTIDRLLELLAQARAVAATALRDTPEDLLNPSRAECLDRLQSNISAALQCYLNEKRVRDGR